MEYRDDIDACSIYTCQAVELDLLIIATMFSV